MNQFITPARNFKYKFFIIFFLLSLGLKAQPTTDMLDMLPDSQTTEKVRNAFKSTRVINSQSMEQLGHGVLDFRIQHRFGFVNQGAYEFWGLDQASMRLGFDYGVLDWLTLGVGRSTYKKEYDGLVKAKILWQTKGKKNFPFSLTYVGGVTCETMKWTNPDQQNYFSSRLAYYNELVIGRKFSELFSAQISPTMVHRNLVEDSSTPNDVWSIGAGARLKLTKRIALTFDYNYRLNDTSDPLYHNYMGIGIDIETGGHVFQLQFTNATGMNERAYITETTGDWLKGDVRFGFNLSRVFTLHDPKKKN